MWKVWSKANKDFSLKWGKLGKLRQVGASWDELGQVGTSWNPKKLQNFDIKKNVLGRKKERRRI